MAVFYLVYVSQCASELTPADHEEILKESRSYNTDRGITGILLYAEGSAGSDGTFMQLLEGAEDEIEQLRKRIFNDKRHHTKVVIEQGNKESRDFPDWSMAFKTAATSDLKSYPAFTELGDVHFHERCAAGEIGGALAFLCEFWEDA